MYSLKKHKSCHPDSLPHAGILRSGSCSCPECSSGDIDLNLNGDGRWKAEWFPAPCQVKNGTFKYVSVGDLSNPYWFQFSVSNTRCALNLSRQPGISQCSFQKRNNRSPMQSSGFSNLQWQLGLTLFSSVSKTVNLLCQAGVEGTLQCRAKWCSR